MPSKAAKQLEKLKSEKKLLLALIFAMVAVFLWVVVSLVSTKGQQVISPELMKLAEPLVPTLDQNVLENLENRAYIQPDQMEDFPIYALVELRMGEYQLVDVVSQSIQELTQQQEEISQVEPETITQPDSLEAESQFGQSLQLEAEEEDEEIGVAEDQGEESEVTPMLEVE